MVGNSALSSSTDSPSDSQTNTKRRGANFLQKLHIRELRGSFQTHQYGPKLKLFQDVPARLKFPLNELVPPAVLNDGHVFLGFSKDGQYVLSYTSQMEVDLPFTLPAYAYKLYYWRFIPHEMLNKVSEIRLFRGFEIASELLISVCQWPSDNSKIVIHGFSPLGDQEYRAPQNPCYLTIAAVPPIYPCEDCETSYNNFHPDDDDEEWDAQKSMCLFHGFMIHVQYHLVPPFPQFNPKVSLKRDGRVVLNTGDSLIALSITTEVKNNIASQTNCSEPFAGCTCSGSLCGCVKQRLSSPGCTVVTPTSYETSDSDSGSVYSPQNSASNFSNLLESGNICWEQFIDSPKCLTSCKTGSIHAEEPSSTPISSIGSDGLKFSSDPGLSLSASGDTASSTSSATVFELFASPGRRSRHKFYSSKLEFKDEDKCELLNEGNKCDVGNDILTLNDREFPDASEVHDRCTETCTSHARPCKHSSINLRGLPDGGLLSYSRAQCDDVNWIVNSQNLKSGYMESMKENLSPALETWSHQGKNMDSNTKRITEIALSPPPLPRCTSPENGTAASQTILNCITCASRVFVPHVDANVSNENEEEDLGNSAYQNSLSFEVYWPSATRLVPCPTSLLQEVTGPVLVVKQAAFDVEPYLHEMAQRLCSEAGQKYQAFTDYDIQIVDVSADTDDVLALVVMLVQATPKNKGLSKCQRNFSGITRKQYEAGFKFLWNIQTGKYSVVDTEDLREIGILGGNALIFPHLWNPGRKKCILLQEKLLPPCAPMQEVLVLSNEPVFTGISLQEFSPSSGDVAIVKNKRSGQMC